MVWSYSGDPTLSNKDAVRFEIGDTIQLEPLLEDGEITYALGREPNLLSAAARCCEAIAAKFAREADNKLGPQSISASQKYAQYTNKAIVLRKQGGTHKVPYSGNESKADNALDKTDQDLKQPAFERNFMSNIKVSNELRE